MIESYFFKSKSIKTTQHAAITHANTSNGIKSVTLVVLYLSTVPLSMLIWAFLFQFGPIQQDPSVSPHEVLG